MPRARGSPVQPTSAGGGPPRSRVGTLAHPAAGARGAAPSSPHPAPPGASVVGSSAAWLSGAAAPGQRGTRAPRRAGQRRWRVYRRWAGWQPWDVPGCALRGARICGNSSTVCLRKRFLTGQACRRCRTSRRLSSPTPPSERRLLAVAPGLSEESARRSGRAARRLRCGEWGHSAGPVVGKATTACNGAAQVVLRGGTCSCKPALRSWLGGRPRHSGGICRHALPALEEARYSDPRAA